MRRRLLLLLGAALLPPLGGCSRLTTLGARFIDGRLAFVPLDGSVGCIRDIAIVDARTEEPMWVVSRRPGQPQCSGGVPIVYGQLPGRPASPARPLVAGRDYRIEGTAEGGNYLTGRFSLEPVRGYRLRDLPPESMTSGVETLVANENLYQ